MTTPRALLERIQARFVPLLLEPELLEAKLMQALQAYQDHAGHMSKVILPGRDLLIPFPTDYLELVHVVDNRRGLVYSDIMPDGIHLELDRRDREPFVMTYLVRLDNVVIDKYELPPSIVGMVGDYLAALIDHENSARKRRVQEASKFNTIDIPDEATLFQRIQDIEEKMASKRLIFFGASVLP
jgi:hypothetical protein